MDHKALVSKCEEALRAGQAQVVAHLLSDLNVAKIPRAMRLNLANICRRANLISVGLRILTALVRDEEASHEEKAEYAVLLERCGAVAESLRVLREVDSAQVPVARLYRAFCHFKSWDYAAAIPELHIYAQGNLSPYASLIAQVNLAAAQVVTRDYDEALRLLRENIQFAKAQGFSRLQANCLELQAQVHFHRSDFRSARLSLAQASEILGGENTAEQFFVVKWQKILEAFDSKSGDGLSELRAEALVRGDFESAREADLFHLMIQQDPARLKYLYLGTPFAAYRERIRHKLNCGELNEDLLFGSPSGPVFDVRSGSVSAQTHEALNPGKKNHQLLAVLLNDLYRPARVGGLFAALYPEERFDIFTSPARVHQVIFRTRQWLFENEIPVEIVEKNHAYSLSIAGDFAFRIPAQVTDVGGYAAQFNRLEILFRDGAKVSRQQANNVLALSPASCKRVLKWACENGKIRREGFKYSRVA